jgi:hypothetical protein
MISATLRVARIALWIRCRRPPSETKRVSPLSSSDQRRAIRDFCDAPRRADRAVDPLSSSSLGDQTRVSSLVLRSAARDPGFLRRSASRGSR